MQMAGEDINTISNIVTQLSSATIDHRGMPSTRGPAALLWRDWMDRWTGQWARSSSTMSKAEAGARKEG
jgi:hypothetical protein